MAKKLILNESLLDFDLSRLVDYYVKINIGDTDDIYNIKKRLSKLDKTDIEFFVLYSEYLSYNKMCEFYNVSKFKIFTELKRIKECLNN